jgi:hypothetical protein
MGKLIHKIPGGYAVEDAENQKVIPAGHIIPFGFLERVAHEGIVINDLPIFDSWQTRFPEKYRKMLDDLCAVYATKMQAPFIEVRYCHDLRLSRDRETLEGNLWCEAQLYVWNPAVRRSS